MDESYRHFYLYAKHWYKTADLVEDLKKITAERCGLDHKKVSVKDVICVLTGAVKHHVDFEKFMNDLMQNRWFYTSLDMETLLIKTMLPVLMRVDGKDCPWIGRPDPAILPLKGETNA